MRSARVVTQLILITLFPLSVCMAEEHDAIFDSPVGHTCFRDLLQKAGWGLAGPYERAAFVIEQNDGSMVCQPWPSAHSYLSESFHGLMPERTLAIVHTHPVDYRMPSEKDREEATRLGIPIYVVSLRGVYKANPGSPGVAMLAERQSWIGEAPRGLISGSVAASR